MVRVDNEAVSAPRLDSSIKLSGQPHEDKIRGGSRMGNMDVPGLVSFGFFLVLLGAIYLSTPNAVDAIRALIDDFTLVEIPGSPRWVFPAPASNHPVIYGSVERFCFAFGASQVIVLILRFVYRSSLSRKAKSVSDVFFWLGAAYIADLLKTGVLNWFMFWSGFIIFAGLSLIIRSLIVLALGEKAI